MFKRCLTMVIGLPIVIAVIVFANKYVVDAIVAVLAISAIYEYTKCTRNKFKTIMWVGIVTAAMISLIHFIPCEYL